MRLDTLEVGDSFKTSWTQRSGTLTHLGEGSVGVRIQIPGYEFQATGLNGEKITVKISAKFELQRWSPATEVEV